GVTKRVERPKYARKAVQPSLKDSSTIGGVALGGCASPVAALGGAMELSFMREAATPREVSALSSAGPRFSASVAGKLSSRALAEWSESTRLTAESAPSMPARKVPSSLNHNSDGALSNT